MAIWKHYIVLFGGFYDPGIRSACYTLSQRHGDTHIELEISKLPK